MFVFTEEFFYSWANEIAEKLWERYHFNFRLSLWNQLHFSTYIRGTCLCSCCNGLWFSCIYTSVLVQGGPTDLKIMCNWCIKKRTFSNTSSLLLTFYFIFADLKSLLRCNYYCKLLSFIWGKYFYLLNQRKDNSKILNVLRIIWRFVCLKTNRFSIRSPPVFTLSVAGFWHQL